MASSATVISKTEISPNIIRWLVSLTTVTSGSTGYFALPADPFTNCTLRDFSIVCSSDDLDIALSNSDAITHPSIYELYRVEEINLHYSKNDIGVLFSPNGSYIYCLIDNSGGSTATGTTYVSYTLVR